MKTNEWELLKQLNETLNKYNKTLEAHNETLKELIQTKEELEERCGDLIELHSDNYMMLVRLAELGDPDAMEEMERLEELSIRRNN